NPAAPARSGPAPVSSSNAAEPRYARTTRSLQMFDASPEEYVPWLAERFASPITSGALPPSALSDAHYARLRFHRWRFAQRRSSPDLPETGPFTAGLTAEQRR